MLKGVIEKTGGARLIRRLVSIDDEDYLSFVAHERLPELRTIAIDYRQFNNDFMSCKYDHQTHRLTIKLPDWQAVTFVLRDDIMVLAKDDFDCDSFRRDLKKAMRQHADKEYAARFAASVA